MAELIRASFLSGYLELVDELGGDPTSLLRAQKIPRRALLDPARMLEQRAVSGLLERTAAAFRCPDLGIRLSARQDISVAGPLAVVMRNCATVGDAFRDVARYLNLFGPAPHVVVDKIPGTKDSLVRTELWMQSPGVYPQTMELFVSGMHMILRSLTDGRARAKAVYFPHAAISPLETYRRAFTGPVTFSHSFAGLAISSTEWARPIEGRNSEVHQIAHAYLDLQLKSSPADLTSQVRRLVATLLASGKCARAEVADALNLHPRTLSRRLAEEGVTFEDVVEQERAAVAERLLSQRDVPLSQIAALLGYSEPSTFTRSVHRWFKESPSAARQRLLKSTNRRVQRTP